MQKDHLKFLVTIAISTLIHSSLSAQLRIGVDKPDPIDTVNLSVTKNVTSFLEQQKVHKAIAYFTFISETDRKAKTKQLEKLSKDIKKIKVKTKVLFQTSYKNYKDSFNIDQVIYYNEDGRFYLFELFFLKGDVSSKIVDIFIKDPTALEKKRKEINQFRKKNPNIPQPPQNLPPGVYIKERNSE
ncbi:hypothetical protein [Lacibacter sp. H407]|uniref:hypothetical protein n=1 Tax=Lacibacter sp. H407 TaxID=3133423 RepID=UPI0030BB4549